LLVFTNRHCSAPAGWHWSTGPATTQQKKPPLRLKSINFDHEIMEIGIICSNLIEKSHHSSNPVQNSAKFVASLVKKDSLKRICNGQG
jgi:hypothetical protein